MHLFQPGSPQPVTITDLHKSFGDLSVLAGVDLALDGRQTTAIVGPNGAGKTTLIKSILGLVRPDSGKIRVLGADTTVSVAYREHIGYMPQHPHFPENLTGHQMMSMLRKLRGPVHDEHTTLLRSLRLDGEMDKPFRVLSGGTRQKIAAVLAFLFHAPILILDEPTAGLDPVSSAAMKDYIRQRRDEGACTVLTSHVLADLEELADRIVFLLDGRIRFDGKLEDLRAATGQDRLERAIASLIEGEAA
jgi:Cu-processing system ATP-binding protein